MIETIDVASQLVDSKVEFYVSDPWEFGTEHGCGPFQATIFRASSRCVLIRLDTPLTFDGTRYEYIVVAPRHDNVSLSDLETGERISCNMYQGSPNASVADPESFGIKRWRGETRMLIGDIRRVDTSGGNTTSVASGAGL